VDPPSNTKAESRGLLRALSSLNCSCSRGNKSKNDPYGMGVNVSETTFVSSEVGASWKVFEEEGSIISDSFPLLTTSTAKSDWGSKV
jgi:hypothetical protein